MRRLALLLCLLAAPAWALVSIVNDAPQHGAVAATYVLDQKSGAEACYSLRACSAAIAAAATQPLINIIRASDSHTCDVLVGTDGGFALTANCSTGGDNGSTASSFCNATTCKAITRYNQLGTGTQPDQGAILAVRPTLTFSCVNTTLPCLTYAGAQLLSSSFATRNQPYTISAVGKTTSSGSEQYLFSFYGGTGAGILSFDEGGTAGNNRLYCGGDANVSTTDGQWQAFVGVCNGASSVLNVGGSEATGSGTTATSSLEASGADPGSASFLTGSDAEAVFWPSAATGGERTAICHNQRVYFATAGSC
jgi:hypothetical protein